MISVRAAVLAAALVATTVLTVGLGITEPTTSPTYPTRFLVWNLFLAWIPVAFAVGFASVRSRGWLIPLGLGWLAFLPNSPYLITDLVHLRDGYDLWRHILQYGFAAWTGIILGVVSLWLVHRRLDAECAPVIGWLVVVGSVGLCALGVVIGRFQRWNSWDLVTQPDLVVRSTLGWVRSPLTHVQSTGVAVAVAAFFGLAYLTIWAVSGLDSVRAADGVRKR